MKPDYLGMCRHARIHKQACMNTGKENHHSGFVLPFPAQVYHGNGEIFAFSWGMAAVDRVTGSYFRSSHLPIECLSNLPHLHTLHVGCRQC